MKQSLDPDAFGKVAVLCGGTNSERAVSLESGEAVLKACAELGMDCVALDISSDPVYQIKKARADWAFNILHGDIGENGAISSILDMLGVRYCSSRALSSAIAMNKVFSKRIWQRAGLPIPDYVELSYPCKNPLAVIESYGLQLPLVVKPPSEGSSVGVSIVNDSVQLQQIIEKDIIKYQTLMVESCITGEEITIAILGDQVLPSIRIEIAEPFYDYQAKYLSDTTIMHIPSGLSESMESKMRAIAMQAYTLLDCRIWGRVDFIVRNREEPYLLEVNTLPGMTSHSLVPMAAKAAGLNFTQLVERIFMLSQQQYSHEYSG